MRYLMLIGLMVSFSAIACPDLAGEYLCKRGSASSYRSIETTADGFRISRDGNITDYVTDGVTVQNVPETDSMTDGKFTSQCESDKFVVDFTATLLYEGAVVGKQVSKTTYQLKNQQLHIISKVKVKGFPLPTIKEVCTLQ